ncbi:MAG: glycosyltransferase family 2 protein [Muribaculaceae bacterium]|nr:glycosyltransferase family 2 protein [Muribaculaceae bacterium]
MLTASIVTYKVDLDELGRALEPVTSVAKRVFVVDNAREARVEDFCSGYANVTYIPHDNDGYGAGNNAAIRLAMNMGADYHLVMNSDLVFEADDLRSMVEYMDANPDIGLLHPRILGLDGRDQYTARLIPTPFDLIIRRFFPGWIFKGSRRRYLLQDADHSRIFDVHYVQGSFMLLRVSALRDAGLFDERFFMYPEDIDLSRRVAERWRVTYFPHATVTHAHRAASYANLKMLRIHMANMIRYFNKWGWLCDPARKAANRQTLRRIADGMGRSR